MVDSNFRVLLRSIFGAEVAVIYVVVEPYHSRHWRHTFIEKAPHGEACRKLHHLPLVA